MKNNTKIDLIEEAMINGYNANKSQIDIPESWQHDVMAKIHQINIEEFSVISITENKLLRFSWIAASIAATLTIAFTFFFTSPKEDFETEYINCNTIEIILGELE